MTTTIYTGLVLGDVLRLRKHRDVINLNIGIIRHHVERGIQTGVPAPAHMLAELADLVTELEQVIRELTDRESAYKTDNTRFLP